MWSNIWNVHRLNEVNEIHLTSAMAGKLLVSIQPFNDEHHAQFQNMAAFVPERHQIMDPNMDWQKHQEQADAERKIRDEELLSEAFFVDFKGQQLELVPINENRQTFTTKARFLEMQKEFEDLLARIHANKGRIPMVFDSEHASEDEVASEDENEEEEVTLWIDEEKLDEEVFEANK